MNNLVSTDWLEKNLNNVRIFDGSWHLPNTNRDALNEFNLFHIENASFFDIDKYSDHKSDLPHMLPSKDIWEKIMSDLGVNNSDHIIVYDNSDVFSSCRVWFTFLYFGHDSSLVSVLDGGLKKWLIEKRAVTNVKKNFGPSSYVAYENKSLVLNKSQINENIKNKSFELVDARSNERFLGNQPEVRKDLKSGNIEGSKNLPFTEIINIDDHTFKKDIDLISIFKKKNINPHEKIAFTCGSGITACVLGLTNSIISGKKPIIYDGSWAEYGKLK